MANTRGIRHAFRRPFRFGRRRPKVYWVTDSWNSENISLNRIDVNTLNLMENQDWESEDTLVRKRGTLRRVIAELHPEIAFQTSESRVEPFGFSLKWMLHVTDSDDTDLGSIKTAVRGSLIQSTRTLQCGVYGMQFEQDTTDTLNNQPTAYFKPNISIDWRGKVRMGPDDKVFLSFAESHTVAFSDVTVDNLLSCWLSGWTRCLVSPF